MTTLAQGAPRPRSGTDPRWLARRRWARAGWVYLALIVFSIVFMGPLLIGTLSSLKTNPLEYPPRLNFEQVRPRNWAAAWGLGSAGGGDPWFGGLAPGASFPFSVSYLVPEGQAPQPPQIAIARRRPGGGSGALRPIDFAADYARIENLRQTALEPATLPDGRPGRRVSYEFRVVYPQDAPNVTDPNRPPPRVDRLPLDLTVPQNQVFASATLDPSRLERFGEVQSWDNVTAGVIGYVFRNYVRAFDETRSFTTGASLFLAWVGNSFLLVILKVASSLLFCSMAGYALARLQFPGRTALFLFIIFTMTIPAQVTFISNYLVLRDGIFGLSRLWGQSTLLNSIIGLWLVQPWIAQASVFLMRQFFETLPREIEEAAKIDGATIWQTFWRVIMPLAAPALGALTITSAQGAWNEYFWALVVLQTPTDNFTLPIGLNSFQRTYGAAGDYGLILAGAVLSAIPVIVLFIVFQRYFVQGVAFTGGKE